MFIEIVEYEAFANYSRTSVRDQQKSLYIKHCQFNDVSPLANQSSG